MTPDTLPQELRDAFQPRIKAHFNKYAVIREEMQDANLSRPNTAPDYGVKENDPAFMLRVKEYRDAGEVLMADFRKAGGTEPEWNAMVQSLIKKRLI